MSVQCPHCGGEFQVELTLSVPAVKHVEIPISPKPVQPITALPSPKFAVHTDAGKLRRAVHKAGYPSTAKTGTIFNDKRDFGRRLKMWTRLGQSLADTESAALKNAINAEFRDRMLRVCVLGGEILVYLNS